MTRTYFTCVECMNRLTTGEVKKKLIASGIHAKGMMCQRCYQRNTRTVEDVLKDLRGNNVQARL